MEGSDRRWCSVCSHCRVVVEDTKVRSPWSFQLRLNLHPTHGHRTLCGFYRPVFPKLFFVPLHKCYIRKNSTVRKTNKNVTKSRCDEIQIFFQFQF